MNVFAWAYLGGLVGAALMDITESVVARMGITSGVRVALLGRWVAGFAKGQLAHPDIRRAEVHPAEVRLGWAFHYLVAGGGVALVYPVLMELLNWPIQSYPLSSGLLFGVATSVLPWFVLLPLFGWGVWGRRGPVGSNALLASVLSHVPYGFGVAATILVGIDGRA
ncbi:MAG TPA: DUF2938 family protein [Aquabacterium sp.]|nr:DUF2938 family protein [Aquabacterium sp.]